MTEIDLLSLLKQPQNRQNIWNNYFQDWISDNEGQWTLKDSKQITFIEDCSSYLLETVSRLWHREQEPVQNLPVLWVDKMIFEGERPRLSSPDRAPTRRKLRKERTPETCRGSSLSTQQSNNQCVWESWSLAGKELPEGLARTPGIQSAQAHKPNWKTSPFVGFWIKC